MIKQTLTWTALPKSSSGPKQAGTELRLSVFVAPRLWNDDLSVTTVLLSAFPDWLDWPATVGQAAFQVEFDGGPTLPAVAENVNLRSDLWQALFKPTTTVKPFVFEDLSGVRFHSFPAVEIHDTVKGVYQRASTEASYGGGTELPGSDVLADDPDLTDIAREVRPQPPYEPPEDLDRGPVFVGKKEPPDDEEPVGGPQGCVGCLLWPFQLIQRLLKSLGFSVFALPMSAEPVSGASQPAPSMEPGMAAGPLPEAVPEGSPSASEPAAAPASFSTAAASVTQAAFNDLHGYVQPHSETSVPLPSLIEVEDKFDFHQMISSLGDYPILMRQLGLVIDLVVTLDANLPADVGKVRVIPNLALSFASSHGTPKTHYDLDPDHFMVRPRPGSDIRGGLLRLNDPNRFRVVQEDVVGSGLKLQNTATNLRGMKLLQTRPANAPEEAGLPALQTAGISIVRPSQIAELTRRIDHSYAMNSFLSAIDLAPVPVHGGGGPPPPPSDELFADDLVRGYRLDVWDDHGDAWHSLCRRLGRYDFLEGANGPISLVDEEDEGFVQMAATESLVDVPQRELKVHESLFTWDGWSLVAPRPGKTILPDQTTGQADNEAVTQFKLETSFRPKSGSLPRLRFGWKHRVRARVVDLAGNSVFEPDDAAFTVAQPEVTPEFLFHRFEPVAPPSVVLKDLPVEGESLENIVVRSTIHDAPAEVANQSTQRHVVPPKTSQLMAERHEIFDGTPHILTDQAAYDLASREAGSLTERMNLITGSLEPIPGIEKHEDAAQNRVYWLQVEDVFEVAFLPDPFARGVLLMGLPGMAAPNQVVDDVNRIVFSGAWPDLVPFRLRIEGLKDGLGPPAQPAWNVGDRVLTVQVPQGETIRVRYSSFFNKADLEMMGVWGWVKEANPGNMADLEKLATDGRNWLHLPFRELVLVHAVQQPLTIPVASQLNIVPDKKVGDTGVTLDGQIDIDAKSTGKIDLKAAWTDPFDDPTKPSFDAATDRVQTEMQVEEIVAHDSTNDQLPVKAVAHTLGDAKYHRVTYAAIGTTRYREYFPAAVQANPQDLIRPTPAEVGTPPADNALFELDVPNSARPDGVNPRYAVPAFSWQASENAGIITKERRGGGLRLYMDRPWFSSGAGELLGLVLRRPADSPLSDNWMKLRKFSSEWGMDPIWHADETRPLAKSDFANAVVDDTGLTLPEVPNIKVDVVGFEPQYNTDRDLWFCDIVFGATTQYFPFVRLGLVRYQPISVPNAHLSRVVESDFIQVLPHRTVTYDVSQVNVVNAVKIEVNGPAYLQRKAGQFSSPIVFARIEQRRFSTGDELGWETVGTQRIPVVQQAVEKTVWSGEVQLPSSPPNPLRIVVLEAEVYATDPQAHGKVEAGILSELFPLGDDIPGAGSTAVRNLGYRIVFADAIELP